MVVIRGMKGAAIVIRPSSRAFACLRPRGSNLFAGGLAADGTLLANVYPDRSSSGQA